MSIDWDQLGQPRFDRVVEDLIRRRFKNTGTVTAFDGRGGDGGIDIELVTADGKRRIFQLKYFPEGFSSGWARSRRPQIKKSYEAALGHNPDEWTLVTPGVLTPSERKFVEKLNSGAPTPQISIIGRDTLDSWLADDPRLDECLQRDPNTTLERMARTYNQERAALLAGMSDIATRVRDLGSVIDSSDPGWTVDFARIGQREALLVRPQHPGAAERSPIRFSVQTRPLGEEHAELRDHIERGLGYATSTPVVIPGEVVESVAFAGPAFIAGDYPPGEVHIGSFTHTPAVGKPLEIKIWDDDEFVASFQGRITHAARGAVGGSVEASFYDDRLKVQFRLPHTDDPAQLPKSKALRPGVDLTIAYGADPPDLVEKVLATARCIRACTRLEIHIDGEAAASMAGFPKINSENYDEDLITIEQYAYDLSVVQQHCNQYFDIPKFIEPGDRVAMRVARLLVEGHLVACPRAQRFTAEIASDDSKELREELLKPRFVAWRAATPYEVTAGGRTLTIGEVYAVHHAATAINAEEAIEALESGRGKGFHVHYRPGDDPYFYLTLADRPASEVVHKKIAQWSLIGVDQPGLPEPDPADEVA